ncbi:hypothetical protein HK102_002699 [Quaeritorhiza haematococci]|nr:hypothetical protein HK102_002699 [Quaeritorhiza haematococci]
METFPSIPDKFDHGVAGYWKELRNAKPPENDIFSAMDSFFEERRAWLRTNFAPFIIPDRIDVVNSCDDSDLDILCKECGDWPSTREFFHRKFGLKINGGPSTNELRETAANVDEKYLVRAFKAGFVDTLGSRRFLKSTLAEYAFKWDGGVKYYFPGTACLRSSGSGKSRLATSLVEEGVFGVYVTFMPTKATGYPTRSSIAPTLLQTSNGEHRFLSFFLASYEEVLKAKETGKTPAQFRGITFQRKLASTNRFGHV